MHVETLKLKKKTSLIFEKKNVKFLITWLFLKQGKTTFEAVKFVAKHRSVFKIQPSKGTVTPKMEAARSTET